ncbi:hypothetical protein [Streptomyces apocyni]
MNAKLAHDMAEYLILGACDLSLSHQAQRADRDIGRRGAHDGTRHSPP